ncbi:hypothetical protein SDC9_75725 [bioreactor metagenome]|uniref:Permease n=1 Tax=bioreactor metagenome TaxID=1076179 RepID=A0A644YKS7_9ZZZZ
MDLQTYIFYAAAITALIVSFFKSRAKTLLALKKALKSFENILPQFLVVVLFISFVLTVMNASVISKLIGNDSGWLGVLLAALIGAITLIPAFVAFPTAAMLLEAGAGYTQIGAFISTLTMVGVLTVPIEIKFFGKRITLLRNTVAFFFAFFVAYIIHLMVGMS